MNLDASRERILSQIGFLLEEIEALAAQSDWLPDDVLSTSPLEGQLSIKQLYALIGLYDRKVYLPAVQSILAEERPFLEEPDDRQLLAGRRWDAEPLGEVLEFVRGARTRLLHVLEQLSAESWNRSAILGSEARTVTEIAYAVVRHDADVLRHIALRLHDSRLGDPT